MTVDVLSLSAALEGEKPSEHLARLLNEHGNVARVADAIGVTPATVRLWMSRYSVEKETRYVVFSPFDRSPEVA